MGGVESVSANNEVFFENVSYTLQDETNIASYKIFARGVIY